MVKSKVMNVVFVIDVMRQGGGAQKVLSILLPILQNNQFEVELIVLKKTDQLLEIPEVKTHYLLEQETQGLMVNTFLILDRISQIAEKANIICSFMDFITSYFVAMSAKILNKPYCIFVRCEPSFVAKTFPQSKINEKLYSLCMQNAVRVICNSKSSSQDIIENFGVAKQKIGILYNPIDFKRIEAMVSVGEKFKRENNEIICVSIGRLHQQKNYQILLEACKVLQERKINIRFFVFGEGELREELEARKQKYKLKNIEFLGYQTNMYGFLKTADIFVHLSIYEGFPNAVLEAASVSKPLVLSNIKPHKEIFQKNALFFDTNDVNGLCDCIEILQDEQKRKDFAKLARACVENFLYERFELQLLREFQQIKTYCL
ncbi:glycosyltransferase [Helicobacter sp.]|uniref:glycosyltransferase n=1 Tax=Helicobacter sp. TaxID=218 RepID=UPI00258EA14E|nr:glycosyltransferase [Helicobacter sp.]MCI7765120.1 glycosyltransferase [Helicobacter sp.]